MSADVWLWLMVAGAACAMFGACGAESFHLFGAHELEEYCRRKQRPRAREQVLDHREAYMLGAQAQRALGSAWAISAGVIWYLSAWETVNVSLWQWLEMLLVAVVGLLLVNSWIPFAMATLAAVPFLVHTWRWWQWVSFLAGPGIWGSRAMAALGQRLLGAPPDDNDEEEWLEDEIRAIVSEGQAGGLVEADERDMIEAVIELDEKDVCSVMTPRSKLDALEAATDWDTAVRFVVETGRTRVPVYEERLDQIVGVLFAKDLLRESQLPAEKRRALRELVRKPLIVPESKMLDEMLKQFLSAHTHMAIVVDEYGGVAGIVTIEDILEEIVGEIVDESDLAEPDDFLVLESRRAIVVGAARIDRINQRLGVNLPEDDEFDTIAGLLMQHCKAIPKAGSSFPLGRVTLRVLRATRRSVEQVEILVSDEPNQRDDTSSVDEAA